MFNASDVMSIPTSPGGATAAGDESRTALMALGDTSSQRSASTARPRPHGDVSTNLIEMDSFRYELLYLGLHVVN